MSETSCNWLLECLPCFSMNTPRTFLEGSWQPHRPSEYKVSISTAFNAVSMENGHGGQHFFIILVQSLSHVWLFETPWTAAYQASQSITNSQSLPKLMSIQSVMPSSRFVFCRPFLLLPPILPSIATLRHKQISSIVKVNSSFYISLLKTPTPTNSWEILKHNTNLNETALWSSTFGYAKKTI